MNAAHGEQFDRIRTLLGEEAVQRLSRAHAAVVGLGAVGSYAAEALARSGVGRLTLVDCDTVHPSNLNRQLFALHSTLGRPKAQLAGARVQDINPGCRVAALPVFVHADTMETVLDGPPDVVVDAIDSLTPKVLLLAETLRRGIPLVSSMGASLRTDPGAVRTGSFWEIRGCPLAFQVRRRLRRMNATADFTCVYSVEPVSTRPQEQDTFFRGRPRGRLGSLPTLPGIFGLTAAHAALALLLPGAFHGSPQSVATSVRGCRSPRSSHK